MKENIIGILNSLNKEENYGKKLVISYSYFDIKKEMEATIDDKYESLLKKTIENYNREPIDKILGIKLDNNIIYSDSMENININKDNIHLYYEFMNNEDFKKHKSVLDAVFNERIGIIYKYTGSTDFDSFIKDSLVCTTIGKNNLDDGFIIGSNCFGVEDTLQPINEYIKEIENSDNYKNYVGEKPLNKIIKQYDKSQKSKELKRITIVNDDADIGIKINDIFNEWNSIKNEAQSKAWKEKTLSFKTGTYKQFDLLDMINKLKDESKEETYLEKEFKKELKSLLKPDDNKQKNVKKQR